jgi:hypothetical protein
MCQEHGNLLQAYQRAAAMLSTTLEALEASRSTAPIHEYERLARYVDQYRLKAEQARIKLEQHTAEHGCFPTLEPAAKGTPT